MVSQSPTTALTEAAYDRALELWPTALAGMVRNATVQARWIGDEDAFWFRDDTAQGPRFVVVDATSGSRRPLFDHALVAKALDADAERLPIIDLEIVDDRRALEVMLPNGRRRIDLDTGEVRELPDRVPTEMALGDGRVLIAREHDLWLREAGGEERRVTTNGEPAFAWCVMPEMDLSAVARSRGQSVKPLVGCFPSPDARRVFAVRMDERAVEPYPYLESVPADGSARPKVHWVRQQLTGEASATAPHWSVIDLDTGDQVAVQMPSWPRLEITALMSGCAWWRADGRAIHAVAQTANMDAMALLEIESDTGAVHVLHSEGSDTFVDLNTMLYHRAIARPIPGRDELLWYSQKDGWGQLQTVDLVRGGIRRQVTAGNWPVFDVVAIRGDTVYFTAGGREPGRNPYFRHLYRVSLAGDAPNTGLQLLTPEDADHALGGGPMPGMLQLLGAKAYPSPISASGRYFVDSVSTIAQPTRTLLRRTDGSLVCEVALADVSALIDSGWRPPEAFSAKATDGVTDVYGVLVKPRGFDPSHRYPVIERIYGGPQIIAQPRTFAEGLNGAFMYGVNALAEMGFVVVVMDGPGTPCRSKVFHDMTWQHADRFGIAHHRAAIEGAAATRPWMDLQRVGIAGHSYGGYAAAMAMLLQPGFYKVGVSSAGMYDPMVVQARTSDQHIGLPDFGDGRRVKIRPDEAAPSHAKYAPETYVDDLTGRLLLIYGDLDENVPPAGLLKLAAALIKAGKHHDQLCMPGRNHGFSADPYYHKRLWDYFIEHLQGRAALIHHRLEVKAGQLVLV